ncbi:MAG: precorrin-3B C(17)-methyltransferase [Selenomonadaceae bacterium]|nr:precorrin-3B C(17)-methyltransferase [Selenomonadaceae bacterium]
MGKITVVGMGPGSVSEMTPRVKNAILNADIVVGYKTYLSIIKDIIGDKETLGTGMTGEVERSKKAIELAANGKDVAVVSSGDAGVYGMAGLVLELLFEMDKDNRPKIEIASGISSVFTAAAILGAPLMNDFAVISLSDLLTPWEVVEKRLNAAAMGDFVIALYNPKSKSRKDNINIARDIILKHRGEETPVGIVWNAGRDGERKVITTLNDFTKEDISMFSIVIIGNSATYEKEGFMVTPRGYRQKGMFG